MSNLIIYLLFFGSIALLVLFPFFVLWIIAEIRSSKLLKVAKEYGLSFHKKDKSTLRKNILKGNINNREILIHDRVAFIFKIGSPFIQWNGLDIKKKETIFYVDGQMNKLKNIFIGYPSKRKIIKTIEALKTNKPIHWS